MKRALKYLLGSLLVLPLTLSQAFALTLQDFRNEVFRPGNLPAGEVGNVGAETKVTNVIDFLINLILFASGSIAVLMLIVAAFFLVTSAGEQEKKEKAVKMIKTALIGLMVVILAYALVTNIINLIFRATT